LNAHQTALLSGGLMGFFAVGMGAMGAHHLELTESERAAWSTAVDYQMWHALVLLVTPLISLRTSRAFPFLIATFVAGTVLFSGSIYLLVLTKNPLWGPLTPLGGICILLGWFLLILSVWLHRENRFR
tara:strand:+ start:366 stop:749 length:384 start_codon:yes stop_codon:yes gene_type:complete